jgi:serine/threonine-protein kinase
MQFLRYHGRSVCTPCALPTVPTSIMATCPRCHTGFADGETTCPHDGATLVPDAGSPETPTEDLPAGMQVGEYRIEAKIGEGGFGAVYRAVHPIIGKSAAIKVLNRQFSAVPEIVSRFVAEARAVNQIRNKNIIDIFAFGQLADGRHYFVMELLRGTTLDAYLAARGRLAVGEVAPILRGVVRALAAAHAAGIAHRDLKPENVFVAEDDEGGVVAKLIDFGIAKLLGDGAPASHKTRTGAPIGTPYYMSPEQCRGRGVDHRTDIYALGVLVHVLLTGVRPFDGEDVVDVIMKQIRDAPPRLSEVCPDVPAALDAPVLQMLAKNADDRPQTVALALASLEAAWAPYLDQPLSAPRASGSVRVAPSGADVGDVEALAEARTMMSDAPVPAAPLAPGAPGTTLEPASRTAGETSRPPARALTLAPLAGAALALAAAIGLWVLKSPPAPAAAVTATAVVVTAAPSGAPAPTVAPAEPAEIELRFRATPEIVDVYQGEVWLGTSRDPIRVKRADRVTLTIKADGYAPVELPVSAGDSHVVPVQLVKAAPSAAPAAGAAPAAKAPSSRPAPPARPATPTAPRKGGADPSDVSF